MSCKQDADYGKWCQEKIVKPQFYAKVWLDSQIVSSDMVKNNEIARILDIFASTDKLIIANTGILYALGQQIQRAEHAHFKSFTIRDKRFHSLNDNNHYYNSEIYKLRNAIHQKSIHSTYFFYKHMTAYDIFDTSSLLYGMIVKTDSLLDFMIKHPKKVKSGETTKDGYKKETFQYVLFKDIIRIAPEIVIAEYIDGEIFKPKLQNTNQKTLF